MPDIGPTLANLRLGTVSAYEIHGLVAKDEQLPELFDFDAYRTIRSNRVQNIS